ncbi:MAG: hypothetical protein JW915_09640 [Chitinispirillaceae bacterium]|nr:hypothetical protein [Chitinispirillaceae bacterium]
MKALFRIELPLFLFLMTSQLLAEPIVLKGSMISDLLGRPTRSLRVLDVARNVIPFQIDEVTAEQEYVCPEGVEPNIEDGNGVLDPSDEIVFLLDDCIPGDTAGRCGAGTILKLTKQGQCRFIWITDDPSIPLSSKKYIDYDDQTRLLKTPWFYARFAKDRFHFEQAGVMDRESGTWCDLTDELSIDIRMGALFGLIPIRYSEDNLICFVKRWKAGPVRLIRRGDFHLNLGLGIKGSRAYVNQLCYPQIVKVPVTLHVPIRFGALFRDAFVEMSPVLKKGISGFVYTDYEKFRVTLDGRDTAVDTIFSVHPWAGSLSVNDGKKGYGWVLQTTIPSSSLKGSGTLLRVTPADGKAECGYRLNVDEVEKGYYEITNWVLFAGYKKGEQLYFDNTFITNPISISTNSGLFKNIICNTASPQRKKRRP